MRLDIIEDCVSHIPGDKGGVAGIYNKAEYPKQKQAAMKRWADHIEVLVSGEKADNVTQLLHHGTTSARPSEGIKGLTFDVMIYI